MRPLLAALLLGLIAFPLPAEPKKDDSLGLKTAKSLYDGLRSETLPNGLKIYLKPIPGSSIVTTMVVYKVGSSDEDKTSTGLSHYLEHLMFKGTAKLKPGDIDRISFRSGGENNAYTTTDLTAYHFNMPAGRWKPALQIEADRMRNLRIDKEHEFDKEKGAVINELKRDEDRAWELESKALLPRLFGAKHPYGHPIIGEEKHVRDATEKIIKSHYDRWYHPNNAAIILVGGFDADEATKEIKKLFGSIAKGKLPERKKMPTDRPKVPSRFTMPSKFSQSRLMVGYETVRADHADRPALDVLEGILSAGKSSRLYRALVEGAEIATQASAEHGPGRYPGYMTVSVEVIPGKDNATAEKLLLKEVAKVRETKVTDKELDRVKHQILAAAIFRRESTDGLARSLAEAVTTTSLETAKKYLPSIQAVTAEDIQRVAKKYLDPQRSVSIWSVPPKKKGMGALPGGRKQLARADKPASGGFDLKKTKRVVLDNGLVLLLYENHRLPIVEVRALLRESGLRQPDEKLGIAALTGSLLDEGTKTRTGKEIARAIENVGGQLSLSSAGGRVRTLSPDKKLGLELLFDCLMNPSFPKDSFNRRRTQQLAQIGENETLPEERAHQAFLSAVYGKHPLGRPALGTTKTVKGLTVADCAAFHRRVFVPNNVILAIAGDFNSKEVIAEVKKLTKDWKKSALPALKLPTIEKSKASQKILSMPEAAQLHLYMGHAGVTRKNPDYYKLLVMDYIFGVGPGFTDRLSSRLRDREGLAYTVTASITETAGDYPGAFTFYIGTDNENLAKAKKLFLEELKRLRETKPGAKELADVKTYLTGSRLLTLGSNGGIATQLLAIERYGLGLSYLDDFRKGIEKVTAEDVQAMAKKYLDPERLTLVAAGAVDKEGKVVKKK